jgi:hypothetical protein
MNTDGRRKIMNLEKAEKTEKEDFRTTVRR